MRLLSTVFCFLFSCSVYAAGLSDFTPSAAKDDSESKRTKGARVHTVDKYLVERSKAYEKVKLNIRTECANQDFANQKNCMTAIRNDFNDKYPNRGTKEYVQKFYIKFNKEQAEAKQRELQKLLTTVHYVADKKNKDTELLHSMVKGELLFLEELVLKIDPIPY